MHLQEAKASPKFIHVHLGTWGWLFPQVGTPPVGHGSLFLTLYLTYQPVQRGNPSSGKSRAPCPGSTMPSLGPKALWGLQQSKPRPTFCCLGSSGSPDSGSPVTVAVTVQNTLGYGWPGHVDILPSRAQSLSAQGLCPIQNLWWGLNKLR